MKQLEFNNAPKLLLFINIVVALFYFSWWLDFSHIGNPILYGFLLFGEIYHIGMALLFWHTVWPKNKKFEVISSGIINFYPLVDIFITVAGEEKEVIYKTALAAKNLDYPKFSIYILNDGFVSKKDNFKEAEEVAQVLGISCITRTIPGGAKAGNINNALKQTQGEIVVILDSDMRVGADFLKKVIPFFQDKNVGFVQTPQYYKNKDLNTVTDGAWKQQEFFFGPIMKGKEKNNASFICGTNVAIRRKALEDVGGMDEKNIAEDFLTSLAIHQKGWRSYYLTEVLAEGLAPEDLLSYFKQQLRWARGSLEVLFGSNPLFKKGLTLRQKLEYLSSALFYFNGVVALIDIIIPLIFLYFNIQAVSATTTSFAIFFIPFMFLNLYTLSLVSNNNLTFKAIAYSQSSFALQLLALKSVLFNEKMGFSITPKHAQQGNFLSLVYPHIFYIVLAIAGAFVSIQRQGVNPSVVTNIAWCIFNIVMFLPFIYAALSWDRVFKKETKVVKDLRLR